MFPLRMFPACERGDPSRSCLMLVFFPRILMFVTILIFMACGAVAGVLAGLLGVGGGIVIVPMLDVVFTQLGYDHNVIHQLALGTSLASIMVTSISSSRDLKSIFSSPSMKGILNCLIYIPEYVRILQRYENPDIYDRWLSGFFLPGHYRACMSFSFL